MFLLIKTNCLLCLITKHGPARALLELYKAWDTSRYGFGKEGDLVIYHSPISDAIIKGGMEKTYAFHMDKRRMKSNKLLGIFSVA